MKIEKFEDIVAWQKGRQLVLHCYDVFGNHKDFGFRDQILRAAVSVMNNIAEGYERKGNKEFKKFLYIAKGSSAEVRSMLYVADDLRYTDKKSFEDIYQLSLEVSKIISGLIKTL